MSSTQVAPEAAQEQPKTTQPTSMEVLNAIVDEQSRKQYEMAYADRFAAQTYAKGAGVEPADAAMLIALGRDYGWGAAHSLQRLFIEKRSGKPCLYADARANMLAKAGYSWVPVVHDAKECTYQFKFRGEWMLDAHDKPLRLSMTIDQANKAGWVANSRGAEKKEGNYDKVPEDMLFARMITRFHKRHAPGVDGSAISDSFDLLERVADETERTVLNKTDSAIDELKQRMEVAANAVHG